MEASKPKGPKPAGGALPGLPDSLTDHEVQKLIVVKPSLRR